MQWYSAAVQEGSKVDRPTIREQVLMPSKKKLPTVMPAELEQTLGDRLKRSMRRVDLSVADMADFFEVHRNTISGWLADRSRPQKLFLRLWAEKTEVHLAYLIDGTWPAECPDFERQAAPERNSKAKRARPARTARRRTAG